MSQTRIELSLDPEIITLLRTVAIKKYGNLRSVSRLIEDLAAAMCPECGDIHIHELKTPNIDIEAIKAARLEYMKRTNMANVNCSYGEFGSCSFSPERNVSCRTCGALFITYPSLSLCCPDCRSLDLSYIDDTEYVKLKYEDRYAAKLSDEEKKTAREALRVENEKFRIELEKSKQEEKRKA